MMCCTACGATSRTTVASRAPGGGARPMRFVLDHTRDCPFAEATRMGTLAAWVEKHGYPLVDRDERARK